MDLMLLLQAIMALVLVLGLMFVVFWFVKYCELQGCKSSLLKKFTRQSNINVVEIKRIDSKNAVAVVCYDGEEYVLLLGAVNNEESG